MLCGPFMNKLQSKLIIIIPSLKPNTLDGMFKNSTWTRHPQYRLRAADRASLISWAKDVLASIPSFTKSAQARTTL